MEAQHRLEPGMQFGEYDVIRGLGRGGMGAVYEVWNRALERREALKVVVPSADPDAQRRFLREAQVAASLEHPAIVTVYHAGMRDGRSYLAMACVNGRDAERVCADPVRPDDVTAAGWITDIAGALDHAHGRGVVHRDVKPSNILIREDGRAVLTDFGISRSVAAPSMTVTGAIVGTLAYISPEQARGDEPGAPADQYSLACTAYYFLAARTPFEGEAAVVLANHLALRAPPVARWRPEFARTSAVLARALEKSPGSRYPSCGQFAAELARAVDADRSAAAQPSGSARPCDAPRPETIPYAAETLGATALSAAELQRLARWHPPPTRPVVPTPVEVVDYSDFPHRPTRPDRATLRWFAVVGGVTMVLALLVLIG